MTDAPNATKSIAVVGDGGLLTWSLAYYLRKAGWDRVVVVGATGDQPRESSVARGFAAAHPPRWHGPHTLSDAAAWAWFRVLNAVSGTDLPPQARFIDWRAAFDPTFWNWCARTVTKCGERKVEVDDIARSRLLAYQSELLPELMSNVGLHRKDVLLDDAVSDLYFERSTFGEQRYHLVSLEKQNVAFSVSSAIKGKAAASEFPSLFAVKDLIRGCITYEQDIVDPDLLRDALRLVCLKNPAEQSPPPPPQSAPHWSLFSQKYGREGAEAPRGIDGVELHDESVVGFTREGAKVASVELAGGASVPVDAVVLATGMDNLLHLWKAGCYVAPPLYQGASLSADFEASRSEQGYSPSGFPRQSMNVENDLFCAHDRRTGSVRVSGLVKLSPGWLAARWGREDLKGFESPVADGERGAAVLEAVQEQLHRFARLSVRNHRHGASHVDAVTLTPDGLPLIGKVRTEGRFFTRPDNVYLCCGLNIVGSQAAVAAAKLAADATVNAQPSIPLEPYLPDRFWLSG
ncbi:hypothetical protein DIPPA_33746 [Diplonema papillatum]|nr:hypothetical protein DIPPA_33746 [Diplonema papillatum]